MYRLRCWVTSFSNLSLSKAFIFTELKALNEFNNSIDSMFFASFSLAFTNFL